MIRESDWMSHEEFISLLNKADLDWFQKTGEPLFSTDFDLELALRMIMFNLDRFKPILFGLYPETMGRPARHAQTALRSLFLYVATLNRVDSKASIDKWPDVVRNSPKYRVLVGCRTPEDAPPRSSLYDLMNRFWQGDLTRYRFDATDNARRNTRKGKMKVGDDNKIVDTDYTVPIMKESFDAGTPLTHNYERIAQQLLTFLAVYPSIENGCIPTVRCGGIDATAYAEHASPFGTCDCGKARLNCSYRAFCGTRAKFSCPDGSIGRDSGENKPFFGQHLVFFSCYNPEFKFALPISFTLADANRHDSITFFPALQELYRNVPGFLFDYMLGDKAYDHDLIFDLLMDHGTILLSELSEKRRKLQSLPDGVILNSSGIPTCEGGVPMTLVNNNMESQCWEYACPLNTGERTQCHKSGTCIFHMMKGGSVIIDPKESPRIFTVIPRESELFGEIYKLRSGSERINNRILNDHNLKDIRSRNVQHRSLYVSLGCILLHQDAWLKCGILPDGEVARDVFIRLESRLTNPLKSVETPPPKGPKVNTEEYLAMLVKRNEKERTNTIIRLDNVKQMREKIANEMKGHHWQCPKTAHDERIEKGEAAFDNYPPEVQASSRIETPYNENLFVKKWDKTPTDYYEPAVIIDPENTADSLRPQLFRPEEDESFVKAFGKGWRTINIYYDPKTPIHNFVEVKANIWVRSAGVFTTPQQKPIKPESALEKMGFMSISLEPDRYHLDNYVPPVIDGINWVNTYAIESYGFERATGESLLGKKANMEIFPSERLSLQVLSEGIVMENGPPTNNGLQDESPRSTPLQRNNSFRCQPTPKKIVLEKLRRQYHK